MGGEATGSHAGDHRGLHRERLVRSDPHRPDRPRPFPGLRRPVPLRPRRRSGLRGPGPGAGDAADPGVLRRRALRGARWPASSPRRRRRSTSIPAYVEQARRPRPAGWPHTDDPGGARLRRTRARRVQPPTWRRDVEGKADLVEEVARIAGYDALPAEPLPPIARPASGVLTLRQTAHARRAPRAGGRRLRGGADLVVHRRGRRRKRSAAARETLVLENPIAAELDCMRPSILPEPDRGGGPQRPARLRRRAPCSRSARCSPATEPADQRTAIAGDPRAARPAALGPRAGRTTCSR